MNTITQQIKKLLWREKKPKHGNIKDIVKAAQLSPKPDQPQWAQEWDEFVDKNPIGTELKYLGATLVVSKITKSHLLWSHFGGYYWIIRESIECDYLAQGEIKTKSFTVKQFKQITQKR